MKIINGLKAVSKYVFYFSMALIFVMMCFMTADALLQVFGGVGIFGNYEIVEIIMICLVYFSFGYTQTCGGHIGVDLLKDNLPKTAQKILNFIISILNTLMGTIMVWASYKNVLDVHGDHLETATLGIVLFPFYGVVCFGCVILLLMFGISIIENGIKLFTRGDAEEARLAEHK
jgi:TRAP-type C4-dicarboxylate transport system permease small subunit